MSSILRSATTFLLPALAAIVLFPAQAAAHVKWFARPDASHAGPITQFSIAEPAVQAWIAVILVCVVAALLMDRFLPAAPRELISFAHRRQNEIADLFQVLIGVALLVTAVKGAILAPHLHGTAWTGLLLRFVQGTIGVLLIANKAVRAAAAAMVLLFLASAGLFGFVSSLEYFNFLGVALFLLFSSFPVDGRLGKRLRPYAAPLLRVHLGVALGVVAWTEKLIDPALAASVLEQHQLNFMKAIGLDAFSDRLFVLCAGCSELIFAVIFLLGLVTRMNTMALVMFLVSSNLYFFAAGKTDEGFLELTGHLPLFAIALMLFVQGSGTRLRLTGLVFRDAARHAGPEPETYASPSPAPAFALGRRLSVRLVPKASAAPRR